MKWIKEKKNLIFCRVLPIAFMVVGFVRNLVYFWRNGIHILNSDASSEMVLADLLNETEEVITNEWFYSSELRVLNTQLVYKLALELFPNDWHVARCIAIAAFLVILAIAVICLIWTADLKDAGMWGGVALLWPVGQWYALYVIYCSYYIPHIVISLLSLALVFWMGNCTSKVQRGIIVLLIVLLGFVAGLGGVRQLMVCYAPLLVVAGVYFILSHKDAIGLQNIDCFACKKDSFVAASVLMAASAIIGYLVNSYILSEQYHFLSYGETAWNNFDLNQVMTCIGDFIALFGWQEQVAIISGQGIANMLALALGLSVFVVVILLFRSFWKIRFGEQILLLFFVAQFLVNGLFLSQTVEYDASYWLPTVPFAYMILAVGLNVLYRENGNKPKCCVLPCACYIVAVLLCSHSTMLNPFASWVPHNADELLEITEYITERGYMAGYATFWNSNIITELSDGQVEMWTINEDYENLSLYEWLQAVEHMEEYPQGKAFILVPRDALREGSKLMLCAENIIYEDGNYYVYGFENIQQYFVLAE